MILVRFCAGHCACSVNSRSALASRRLADDQQVLASIFVSFAWLLSGFGIVMKFALPLAGQRSVMVAIKVIALCGKVI
jgi:hypothetical protein